MKITQKTFSGGYYFKRFEGESGSEVATLDIPPKITIPLKQGFGQEVPPLVKRGEVVKAGQIIARDDETISSPIHAPVNGTVEAVKRIEYFGEKVRVVSITPDGSSEWMPLEGCSAQWTEFPNEKLEELLYFSGVTALGSSGIPTNYKSSICSPADIEHLIVHHTEAEVFNVSLEVLLKGERLTHFVEGLLMLKTVMANARVHLAFSSPLIEWLFDIDNTLKEKNGFSYYTVKPKYPQHQDEVLIPTILKKKIPYNRLPAEIGVLTFSVQDVLHVYDAVATGKPLIERFVALAGPGFEHHPNLLVRSGTSVQDVIAPHVKQDREYRYVLNSLNTGTALVDLSSPVTKEYRAILALVEKREGEVLSFMKPGFQSDSFANAFLARLLPFKKVLSTNINGEKRGCISCGFCGTCCPAGLYPHLLYHYINREMFDEPPVRYGIFDCIDCNLCTYVCPSKILVAEVLKYGKQKLMEEGFHPYTVESFIDLRDIEEYRGLP